MCGKNSIRLSFTFLLLTLNVSQAGKPCSKQTLSAHWSREWLLKIKCSFSILLSHFVIRNFWEGVMLKGYMLICRSAEGVQGQRKVGNLWSRHKLRVKKAMNKFYNTLCCSLSMSEAERLSMCLRCKHAALLLQ